MLPLRNILKKKNGKLVDLVIPICHKLSWRFQYVQIANTAVSTQERRREREDPFGSAISISVILKIAFLKIVFLKSSLFKIA
jgi:hypothetical protein